MRRETPEVALDPLSLAQNARGGGYGSDGLRL